MRVQYSRLCSLVRGLCFEPRVGLRSSETGSEVCRVAERRLAQRQLFQHAARCSYILNGMDTDAGMEWAVHRLGLLCAVENAEIADRAQC